MTSLHSDQLWSALKSQAKKTKFRSYVAVAFLGPGAFERLPLKPGSLLVVNCNEATVRGCQTDPREVKKYLKHGVSVHNVSNLHAKVFVLGTRAFVGSNNVSSSSEGLVEAAIATRNRNLVRECKRFVQSLAGELISPTEVDRLISLFDPKKLRQLSARGKQRRVRKKVIPQHNPLWAVRTVLGSWQNADYEAERLARPVAEKRLTSRDFKSDDFNWHGSKSAFFRGVRKGDVVLQVHEASPRHVVLMPPQKVILVKRYKKGKRLMIFVEQKKRLRNRRMAELQRQIPSVAKFLRGVQLAQMIRNPQIVHDVQHLWGPD